MEKSKRVKTKIDFQKVIASKKKIISKSFILYSLKREEYDYPRFGFSASKKLGHAVVRVKTRRQVRAMVREILKNKTVLAKDYIIIVRNSFLQHTYQENLDELILLFKKAEEQTKWDYQQNGN